MACGLMGSTARMPVRKIPSNVPAPPIDPRAIGTFFLTELAKIMPVAQVPCVATLNPIVMENLARGELGSLRAYREAFGHRIAAANLCGSFTGTTCQGVMMTDAIYNGVIERLLGEAGAEINKG